MKFVIVSLLLTLSLQAQYHHIQGLNEDLKLSPEVKGDILIGELNCSSCHKSSVKAKEAPVLDGAAQRLKADFIKDFLMNPQKVKKGTTMPDVLHSLPADEKEKVAASLAAYLTEGEKPESKISGDKVTGEGKFKAIGCAACHSPLGENIKNSVPLGDPSVKYHFSGLRDFLFLPHKVRPSGRMPDMKLTKEEAADIAAYLLDGNEKTSKISASVAEGKKYFDMLGCASCHQKEGHKKPQMLEALSGADCKGPSYSLDQSRKDLINSVLKTSGELSDSDKIKRTLAVNNCYVCHERDGIGGPGHRDAFFTTSEGELGQAGRIPPPLTNIGAKLQRPWMRKVLFKGESLRHYMNTRMPQFGEKNIGHLVDLFDKVDKVEPSGLTDVTSKEERKSHRAAGRQLVGIKGNNCISCHNYNGHPSLGLKGMDIVNTSVRLKRDWFYHYMINPTKHRPGIVMPSFWPGGNALQKNILGGDTKEQLRAMWFYFTFGQTQRLPEGLNVPPVELKPENQVKIYRGRSRVAGYRGIAIGFPEKMNMAFNAEIMNYTTFWPGKFVNVNWSGQAPGNFDPAERILPFNKGIPFAELGEDLKWPEKPEKKGREENPAPMFVQNHGYKFKGYYFDKQKNPVLMYSFKGIEIEDSLHVKDGMLIRTLAFNAPAEKEFYFRAASGKVIKSGKGFIINDTLKIEFLSEAKISGADLLMQVILKKGENVLKIKYGSAK